MVAFSIHFVGGGTLAEETGKSVKKIVFLGDSLTAGYELPVEDAYPNLIQQKIQELGLKYTVVNAGVSGDTSADGLRRLDWLLKQKIDVLVVELGINDGLRGIPVKTTQANLQAIISKAKKANPQAKIVLIGMKLPPNMGKKANDEFASMYPALAKANNIPLVPFLLQGVGGVPAFNLSDGIHPTAEGHRRLAENVWKVLKPVL